MSYRGSMHLFMKAMIDLPSALLQTSKGHIPVQAEAVGHPLWCEQQRLGQIPAHTPTQHQDQGRDTTPPQP